MTLHDLSFSAFFQQPGGLGRQGGVAGGVAEGAKTRGFPCPPLGGFGFISVSSI